MTTSLRKITIVMADDDEDDRMFAREALEENSLGGDLHFVDNGEQLLAYLRQEGAYAVPDSAPFPGMILLDLNMPRMDGREVLKEIKADPKLRRIPVVVLTSSAAHGDIFRSYDLGASSYITKPVTFDGLVAAMRTLGMYWTELVELPDAE